MRIMAVVALFTLPPTLGVASPLTGHALGSGSPPVVIRHKPGHHGGPPWARAWRGRYGPNRITECRMREETHSTVADTCAVRLLTQWDSLTTRS